MSLEYALVTSSSLPDEVKESDHYLSVDKSQWLDLVDYSQELVRENPEQKVLFLIVAKGTDEQEEADEKRQSTASAQEQSALLARREAEEKQKKLRSKSRSIFNALYGR